MSSPVSSTEPSGGRPGVVGVAGKCRAGKDLVTGWLLDHGWREINVDRIGHEALAAQHARVVATFGREIVGSGGTIDRRKLGAIVFGDADQLRRLEEIVHPWMRERVREEIDAWRAVAPADRAAGGERGLVINAALLFHMQLDRLCDAVILVRAPLWARVRRARSRDGLPFHRILQRLWVQRRLDTQAFASPADTITVENGRSPESLYAELGELPQLE